LEYHLVNHHQTVPTRIGVVSFLPCDDSPQFPTKEKHDNAKKKGKTERKTFHTREISFVCYVRYDNIGISPRIKRFVAASRERKQKGLVLPRISERLSSGRHRRSHGDGRRRRRARRSLTVAVGPGDDGGGGDGDDLAAGREALGAVGAARLANDLDRLARGSDAEAADETLRPLTLAVREKKNAR
jgi:hypothetical protein